MNPAEQKTCEMIERTLDGNRAYRKVEDRLYVVRQGSCYVMISVVPLGQERAIVRCVAQLVKGVKMVPALALQLLELNASLRFGAFAYVKQGDLVLLLHSSLGGEALSPEQLLAAVSDVALVADEWDDKIIARFGGQRMQDLLEERVFARVLGTDTNGFEWEE